MPKSVKVQLKQPFGALYGDKGVKEQGVRVDYHDDKWQIAIDSRGYRLLWTRSAKCPCTPPDPQLEQADPTCALCDGSGYYYFGPQVSQDLSQETLTDTQAALIAASSPMMIRGILQSVNVRDKDFEAWGSFRHADAIVTVRNENRLSYRDRLVAIDVNLVQSEVVVIAAAISGPTQLPLRYLVSGAVFMCRSTAQVFKPNVDFQEVNGKVWFVPGHQPAVGTRVTVSYETFPTYVVDTMPHARRVTNQLAKTTRPTSPEGNIQQLPIQAALRLENLAYEQT